MAALAKGLVPLALAAPLALRVRWIRDLLHPKVVLPFVLIAGLITYQLVEKPLMNLFKIGLGARSKADRSRPAAPVPPPAPSGSR